MRQQVTGWGTGRPALRNKALAVLHVALVGMFCVLSSQALAQAPSPWVAPVAAMPRAETLTVRTAWSGPTAQPGDRRVLAVVLDIEPRFHINPDASQIPSEFEFLIPTRLQVTQASPWLGVGAVRYPAAHDVQVNYTGQAQSIKAYEGRTILYVPVQVAPDAPPGDVPLGLSLEYQACDDKNCLPPRTVPLTALLTIVPVGTAASESPAEPDLFKGFDAAGSADRGSPNVALDLFGWELRLNAAGAAGLAMLLLMAGIGGLLLNLTPCVLPLVPIKVLSLSQAAGNRRRCFVLGLAMSVGVVAFWLALGLAMATIAGFTATNQLFQYPAFTLGVGLIIAVMAIGMCGLFAIRLPQVVYRVSPRHDTLVGSVGFGVMTAVLSTPCTAPFMGAAAAWAATQNPAITLTTFMMIGLGMALPYLLLSAFPKLVDRVPRTGPASELVKQVMGLLMLGAAAYFLGIGLAGLIKEPDEPATKLYWWAVAACVAAAGGWLAWRTWGIARSPLRRVVFTAIGILLVATAVLGGLRFTDRGPIDWVSYNPQRLQQALGAGQVVVLEFTAEWCLNCKALEESVLKNRQVVELLGSDGVTPMKVDLTGNNPVGNQKLADVGRVAIPLLVVLAPDGREVFKSDFYTVEQVVSAIKEARGIRGGSTP